MKAGSCPGSGCSSGYLTCVVSFVIHIIVSHHQSCIPISLTMSLSI